MSPASLAPPTSASASASARHAHCSFGLIVTGKGERDFLPQLFGVLMLAAGCSFKVLAFTGQRGAITSPRKQLRMVGTGKTIPDRDAAEIGLPARRHLLAAPHHFVLLIDDLESNRRLQIGEIFARYRAALTTLCPQVVDRAGVHFFANMLEAYYFAHSAAVHQAVRPSAGWSCLAIGWATSRKSSIPKTGSKNCIPVLMSVLPAPKLCPF